MSWEWIGRWSAQEEKRVLTLYKELDSHVLSERLGRTPLAIRRKARALRVVKRVTRPWTQDEDAILIKLYPKSDVGQLSNMLERSVRSLRSRARRLGVLRRQSPVQRQHVRVAP